MGRAQLGGVDCPEGAALAPGDAIAWTSGSSGQGSVGNPWNFDNGCAAKGTCGLPSTAYGPGSSRVSRSGAPNGLGGGWQLFVLYSCYIFWLTL